MKNNFYVLGWTEPARHISFQSTWQTSSFPVRCSTPLSDLSYFTWPSSGLLSSLTCVRRRNSKPVFPPYSMKKDCDYIATKSFSLCTVKTDNNIEIALIIYRCRIYKQFVFICFLGLYLIYLWHPLSHFRELEKQRESASSDIAKKKQEAESAVSPHGTVVVLYVLNVDYLITVLLISVKGSSTFRLHSFTFRLLFVPQ